MCGRVRLSTEWSEIKIKLRFDDRFPAPNFPPRWNVPPTTRMLCAVRDPDTGTRRPEMMRWGLVPSWAKDEKIGYSTFNARAEGFETKPAFRSAWKAGRRCLVVTDGFYEWRQGDKQPFAIGCANGLLTVMAGLWETWRAPNGETVPSCTIITTSPNAVMEPLHDRMPVILAEEHWPAWLGEVPAANEELQAMLRPFAPERMELWPVDRRVGNVRNDGADLVTPIALSE